MSEDDRRDERWTSRVCRPSNTLSFLAWGVGPSVKRLAMSGRWSGLALLLSNSAFAGSSSVTTGEDVDDVKACCRLSDAGTAVVISLLTTGSSDEVLNQGAVLCFPG
ncbi:uncharacterized protein LOC143349086 [Colletes latitarsis]|uniref:uncharacterized protein LOC143349086 n=1 Tax=Colletes latitarsis TaxID=2605962 RepID=UPI0040350EFA